MTGSGLNVSPQTILVGQPLAEDSNGNILPATTAAFALASSGSARRGVVGWQQEGVITRVDWMAVTGGNLLTPGQSYYLASGGRLATSGSQHLGIARSATDLRVMIAPPVLAVPRIWNVSVAPDVSFGSLGDIAINAASGAFYFRTAASWSAPLFLISESLFVAMASSGGGGVLAGDYGGVAPTEAFAGAAALAVDVSNGTLWQWYGGAWH